MLKLSRLLIAWDVLSRSQVEQALYLQATRGGALDTCLLELGFCDELALEEAFAIVAGAPNFIDPRIDLPSARALALLTPVEAKRWRVLPFTTNRGILDVVCHPGDIKLVEKVARKTKMQVRVSLATELRVALLLERHYRVPLAKRFSGVSLFPRGARAGRAKAARLSGVARALPATESGRLVTAGSAAAGGEAVQVPPIAGPLASAAAPRPDSRPLIVLPDPRAQRKAPPPPSGRDTPQIITPARAAALAAAFAPGDSPATESASDLGDDAAPSPELAQLAAKLREVHDRADLPRPVFAYLSAYARRVALFSVQHGMCLGWDAQGPAVRQQRVRNLAIPLRQPSVLREAAESNVYVGRVPSTRVNDEFARCMGEPRLVRVIAVAVRVAEKVAAVLIADCDSDRGFERAFPAMTQAADRIGRAMVRLIIERKSPTHARS